MKDTEYLLALFEQVAASGEPMSDLAQEEIARVASKAKSHRGDSVLAALAVRPDVSAGTRKLLEESPRARVKAAWLSRKDHPSGYVADAVARESRVTVLAEVASHPDASYELVEAIAGVVNTKVAEAVLSRGDSSDKAKALACLSIFESPKATYAQQSLLARTLGEHPELVQQVAQQVSSAAAVWSLVTMRGLEQSYMHVRSEDLLRFAKVVLAQWPNELPPVKDLPSSRWRWNVPMGRYSVAATFILSHPAWDTSSSLDEEFARLACRLQEYSDERDALRECRIRHHGSREEREAVAEAARAREESLLAARESANGDEIIRLLKQGGPDVYAALRLNENVRLEHFDHMAQPESSRSYAAGSSCTPLLVEQVRRGCDPVKAAALAVVLDRSSFSQLPSEIVDALGAGDRKRVGQLIASHRYSGSTETHRWLGPWGLLSLADDEEVLSGVLPGLSLDDLISLMGYEYIPEAKRKLVAAEVSRCLQEGLSDASSWRTFVALAPQAEGSLIEAMSVASLV